GRARSFSWSECAMMSLIAGASAWFFVSTGWLGYYDAWLGLGLLAVGFSRRPWVAGVACVLTPWVDERFVLGFPLALLVRWIRTDHATTPRTFVSWLRREAMMPIALIGGYVALRVLLAGRAGSQTLGEYWRGI